MHEWWEKVARYCKRAKECRSLQLNRKSRNHRQGTITTNWSSVICLVPVPPVPSCSLPAVFSAGKALICCFDQPQSQFNWPQSSSFASLHKHKHRPHPFIGSAWLYYYSLFSRWSNTQGKHLHTPSRYWAVSRISRCLLFSLPHFNLHHGWKGPLAKFTLTEDTFTIASVEFKSIACHPPQTNRSPRATYHPGATGAFSLSLLWLSDTQWWILWTCFCFFYASIWCYVIFILWPKSLSESSAQRAPSLPVATPPFTLCGVACAAETDTNHCGLQSNSKTNKRLWLLNKFKCKDTAATSVSLQNCSVRSVRLAVAALPVHPG